MKARDWLEGVGAALLLLFSYYVAFFHPRNHDLYHHGIPVAHLIGGVLIDLIAVSLLVAVLLVLIRHLPSSAQRVAEAVFAGVIAWIVIDHAFKILFRLLYPVANWENRWDQSALAIPLLMAALALFVPRFSAPAVRAIRFFLVTLSFSALWIVPQLVRVGLARPAIQPVAFHPQSQPGPGLPNRRIIWILFDEFSYHQAFDHPAGGVALPNFERLRASAVSFSSLTPAGYDTDRIIPSLFMNKRFDHFRSTLSGQLWYQDLASQSWVAYEAAGTVFGQAQRGGWNPAIDGWYNPYCQFLAPVLSACHWSPGVTLPMESYGASEEKSSLADAQALPMQVIADVSNRATTPRDLHIAAYQNLMAHTKSLIDDQRFRFIYIHLPVPHPPGIYDRRRHALCRCGSYLDNLVLADDSLDILMKQIAASSSADQTTVIVTSDHSWRILIYRDWPDWTAEEELASGGRFDDRPILLVHFPGQQSGEEVHAVLPEMLEHDMIAAMLEGQINSAGDLVGWSSRLAQSASPQLQAHIAAH